MSPDLDHFAHLDTWLHRWDPRWKVVAFTLLALSMALESSAMRTSPSLERDLLPAALALVVSFALVASARLPLGFVLRRIRPISILIILVLFIFPFTYGGETFALGPLELSLDGLLVGGCIALRSFAVILLVFPALATTRFADALRALRSLRIPPPLVDTAFFAHRYMLIYREQYRRMALSMRSRGFAPRLSWTTLRTAGNAVGMLLVTSIDRVRLISQSMRCRGYESGRLRSIAVFRTRPGDVYRFLLITALAFGFVAWRIA